jgi:Cu+-exporting ATPase
MSNATVTQEQVWCYHCGLPCDEAVITSNEKAFCCHGCKVVFEMIEQYDLCEYYDIESHPGLTARNTQHNEYDFLEEPKIRKQLLEFDSSDFARTTLKIPNMHCSSCIWLLENLHKADRGILRSEVNFNRKEIRVDFNPQKTKLSLIAGLLDGLGYAPRVVAEEEKSGRKLDFTLILKLGIAAFAFGNVMLFSFPEYLGLSPGDKTLGRLFSWLNFGLSLPVILYSASDYFSSALKSFRQRQVNIDVPIALGLLALFLRSTYDILTHTGPGYLDSLTGLVFFLLIGRWFQSLTYENLAFERDFRSYFPLAVQKINGTSFQPVVIFDLKKGDKIRIRNLEIIPADSVLIDRVAFIDYSFVTGESKPTKAVPGDLIYAGGRLIGQPVSLIVEKETSQSHLTNLWNRNAFRKKHESKYRRIIDQSARVFTWIVLAIALATALYWYFYSPAQMWLVLTSVLMVACPCALALAAPFTYGSMMRVFGRYGFYLKNADTIERLSLIDSVVFDKTGTLTHGHLPKIHFEGELTPDEAAGVRLLTSFSTHPLSTLISKSIKERCASEVSQFFERPGLGIEGSIEGRNFRIGSAAFAGFSEKLHVDGATVFVSIDNDVRGYYLVKASVRKQIDSMLTRLGRRCVAMLSGDTGADRATMNRLFPIGTRLKFDQQPADKMNFIDELQAEGRKVLMVGDGLNDGGALKQADVGIAVTDDTGLFTPGCDGILQGTQLHILDQFIWLSRSSSVILKSAFLISFMYNAVALTFAVTGHLTPLIAAILMPVSSISVVAFSTVAVNIAARRTLGATQFAGKIQTHY